jgi:post-segregation antitoxin (ccd killing protein)
MGELVTVSSKIPRDVKERLDEYDINLSKLIRDLLENELERMDEEKLRAMAERAGEILQKIPDEELVTAIRWSRDNR